MNLLESLRETLHAVGWGASSALKPRLLGKISKTTQGMTKHAGVGAIAIQRKCALEGGGFYILKWNLPCANVEVDPLGSKSLHLAESVALRPQNHVQTLSKETHVRHPAFGTWSKQKLLHTVTKSTNQHKALVPC